MYKCSHCGNEFDGKFCPECGTPQHQDKRCPQCGATLPPATRFCNECGYSFYVQPTPQKQANGTTSKTAYSLLRFLPLVLLALFSVLLFIFYATPMAKVELFGFSESSGNVYKGLTEDIPTMKGIAVALWILAFVTLAYTAITAALFFHPTTKNKEISVFGKIRTTLGLVFGYGSTVLYLVFLIVSCVAFGKIKAFDEGMGVCQADACAKLILSFAVIFMVFSLGALVVRVLLNKAQPQLGLEESLNRQQSIEKELMRREQFYVTHTPPAQPAANAKKKLRIAYKHNKRRYDKAKEGNAAASVIWLDTHKVPLIIVAFILVSAVILLCTLIPYFTNIFRVGKVQKIELGDSPEYVQKVLGKPFEGTKTDTKWEYFDDNYTKLLNKLNTVYEQEEKAMESGDFSKLESLAAQEESLTLKLHEKTYDYICVTFSDNVVESMLLEKNRNDSREKTQKTLKKVTVSQEKTFYYYYDNTLNGGFTLDFTFADTETNSGRLFYTAHFTDGTFCRAPIFGSIFDVNGNSATLTWHDDTKSATFTWHDDFTEYTAPIDNIYLIGFISPDGEWYSNYTALQSIVLPENVTSIGDRAFRNCYKLTSIEIPNSVSRIGKDAFYGCSGLTSIHFQGTKAQWKSIEKTKYWNGGMDDYTVYCTDGTISKTEDN